MQRFSAVARVYVIAGRQHGSNFKCFFIARNLNVCQWRVAFFFLHVVAVPSLSPAPDPACVAPGIARENVPILTGISNMVLRPLPYCLHAGNARMQLFSVRGEGVCGCWTTTRFQFQVLFLAINLTVCQCKVLYLLLPVPCSILSYGDVVDCSPYPHFMVWFNAQQPEKGFL